jgi:hypothetical protein
MGRGVRRANEISILEVEAVQLIASLFGVHHVLIDNECRSLRVVGDSLADLSVELVSIILADVLEDVGWIVPNGTKFAKEVEQLLDCYVIAASSQHSLPSYAILIVCPNIS